GLPAGLVQVRELLEMLRLEVVMPQHVDVVLGEFGSLLLDDDASGAEELVGTGGVLLDDLVAGLCLDPGLLRVVHTTGDVAVGVDAPRGAQWIAHGLSSSCHHSVRNSVRSKSRAAKAGGSFAPHSSRASYSAKCAPTDR